METDGANPTSRALLTLELIQGSPGITAERLADKLGVSARAARRYVATLREAGIPVESVRGPYGGYTLGRGLRLPPLTFSSAEALGLVMAVLDGHHDAADPTDPVGSALGKIVRALPEAVAAQAEAVRRTTAPAPDRGAARPDPGTTAALVQAVADRRLVRVGYRSESGREWTADVEPWAVVVRHGRWYLLCRPRPAPTASTAPAGRPDAGTPARGPAVRTYRVDRIREVAVLDGSFVPPDGLDPVHVLEENLAVGWEFEVEAVLEASPERVRRCLPRGLGRLEPLEDGTTRLVGSTSNATWYAGQLAASEVPFRIVRGDEVRAAARELGRRLAAAADGSPARTGADGEEPRDDALPPVDDLPPVGRPADRRRHRTTR